MTNDFITIMLLAINLTIILAWAWHQMFSKPLVFDEQQKPYPPEIDWLLELDEFEEKISS